MKLRAVFNWYNTFVWLWFIRSSIHLCNGHLKNFLEVTLHVFIVLMHICCRYFTLFWSMPTMLVYLFIPKKNWIEINEHHLMACIKYKKKIFKGYEEVHGIKILSMTSSICLPFYFHTINNSHLEMCYMINASFTLTKS